MIVFLLLISLATASIVVAQAYYSDKTQRASAESVLRDYSALVADEVIRRSSADIGYYGYYPLVQALVHEVQPTGYLPETVKAGFLQSSDARLKHAAGLAKSYFQMDSLAASMEFVGERPDDATIDWLQRNLVRVSAQHSESGFQVFNAQVGGSPKTFVAASWPGARTLEKVVGLEVDLAALGQWFSTTLNRQPLVPPSLGHGQVTNAFVHVSIRDQSGVERFRLGKAWPSNLATTKSFGDAYQGIFSGFTVETAIDPRVAAQIIIGGLPRSRLPIFVGLLALNAGLIVTAILQLRREMALQQLRDEFVSSVSHELRTPLTQIRMFAETLLLDRIRTGEEQRRSIEIIDREARRLSGLVENVLRFSRTERKADSLATERRELAPLIRGTVSDFESLINDGGTRIETRLSPGLTANIDPDALRQILINLLDNAVKYGSKQQRVIVGLEPGANLAVLFVEDEGPGIPAAERKRVFEPFQRLERDRQSTVAGTGIGLSVVRNLVDRQGGRCHVASGERGGARFVVELPASRVWQDAEKSRPEVSL